MNQDDKEKSSLMTTTELKNVLKGVAAKQGISLFDLTIRYLKQGIKNDK